MSSLIVVGAGPAGLIAAGIAAKSGIKTTIYESKHKPCMKLAITGKGRCNITNIAPIDDFLSHFNNKGRFLKYSLRKFSNSDLINFINKIGVPTKEERGGRIFPKSDKASSVVLALINWAKKHGVQIVTESRVAELIISNNICSGVVLNNGKKDKAANVLIATGGKSYPATGSTGDGYLFAKNCGHKLVSPRPSLVALETDVIIPETIFGEVVKNVRANLVVDGKKISSEFGEMYFQSKSLGGPIIITLSRRAVPFINKGNVSISLDFKPALSFEKLDKRLLREIRNCPKITIQQILKSLLPSKLVPFFISYNNLEKNKKGSELTSKERKIIRNRLKEMKFNITRPRPWSEAIITAGGISTKDISSKTMESKLVSSLFFAGEVIDIDADTGGYNLQAAFSTGFVAGSAIVNKNINKA